MPKNCKLNSTFRPHISIQSRQYKHKLHKGNRVVMAKSLRKACACLLILDEACFADMSINKVWRRFAPPLFTKGQISGHYIAMRSLAFVVDLGTGWKLLPRSFSGRPSHLELAVLQNMWFFFMFSQFWFFFLEARIFGILEFGALGTWGTWRLGDSGIWSLGGLGCHGAFGPSVALDMPYISKYAMWIWKYLVLSATCVCLNIYIT